MFLFFQTQLLEPIAVYFVWCELVLLTGLMHFSSRGKNFSFVFMFVIQHYITFYICLGFNSPYSKKPTFHIFHLLISSFLHFTLEIHAFQVCPPFGIDNQVVDQNFFKLLTLCWSIHGILVCSKGIHVSISKSFYHIVPDLSLL